jgi:hypothetical protein
MDLPAAQLRRSPRRRARRRAVLLSCAALLGPAPAAAEEAVPPTAPAPGGDTAELDQLRARIGHLREQAGERTAQRAAALVDEGAAAGLDERPVQIYGFLDTGVRRLFFATNSLVSSLAGEAATFVLGGANIYLDAQPSPAWRALIETRVGFYPHGQESIDSTGRFSRVDNTVLDTASSSGRARVQWSGIVIERAWLEWISSQRLALQAGYFLTPFGIWNTDHGTPTLISLVLPGLQVEGAIPQHQTGVQLRGSITRLPWELGYAFYVGNGRPAGLLDQTDDKALGMRLELRRPGPLSTTAGLSAYTGTAEDHSKMLAFDDGSIAVDEMTLYAYREWAVGVDLALDRGPLRLRSEALLRHVRYEDGKHEINPYAAPGTRYPSRYEHFWYVIAAVRLGRFEPYLFNDLVFRSPGRGTSDLALTPSLGTNIYFSPAAQLKLQYAAGKFYNVKQDVESDASEKDLHLLDARLVLAF